MSSEVEEIKDRLSVVDLVGEYIRVSKAGSNWRALCPFHNEKTPSFMLSEERKSWHCFGCGKGGDIFSFVMEMEGLGFREALEQLAQKAGVELKKNEKWQAKGESGDGKKELYKILELATKWYEKNLWEGKGKDKILKYLHERGLTDESIKQFRLGYAPDGWRNVLDFLLKKNFKIADIAKTGLLVEKNKDPNSQQVATRYSLPATNYYDRFRGRIMFPIQDAMGRVVGYSARVEPGGDEKNAKYINTPQTELYDKSKILYGMNFAKAELRKKNEAVLVEGNMDVIASHQAGFPNAVAVSGTALTPEQIKMIKRYTENIKMAFDMDSAGQEATKKSAKICLENDLNVRIVLLPKAKDAAEVIREDKRIWEKALAEAPGLVEYYFEDAFSKHDPQQPVGKKNIARELLNVIKDITNPVIQSHWIKNLSGRLGVGEKTLLDILRSAKNEKRPSPAAAAPEKKNLTRIALLPKRILGLVLFFPETLTKRMGKLMPEYFSGEIEDKVYNAIREYKEKLSLAEVRKNIGEYEAQKYLDEAVFEIEVESEREKFDPKEEFEEAVSAMREEMIKQKIVKISHDIKAAEEKGDRGAIHALIEKFKNLSQDLNK